MAGITIVGGHGKVALLLAAILTRRGHDVRSLIRNPDHVGDVEATGAAAVLADVEHLDIAEMTAARAGCGVLVWSAGAGGGNPSRTYSVDRDAAIRSMEAAEAAGVGRYLMVSYLGARPDHGVPEDNPFFAYAEAKAAADEHLRHSALSWTILGPATLTSGPGTGRIEMRDPDDKGEVSRADVAEVAAAVLESGAGVGRFLGFTNGATPISEAIAAL